MLGMEQSNISRHQEMTRSTGFDPAEFLLESGLLAEWAAAATDCSIRSAMCNSGFQCRRLRRVPEHRLIIADGECDRVMEFRPPRVIKVAVLRAFREHGLVVRPEFYCLRGAGARLGLSVAVFLSV
jgi:hypothetical protein